MAGFVHTSAHGQLAVNSVNLMGPAWRCLNLGAVMSVTMRGDSVLIPTVAGRKARRRRLDEATIGLELLVTGAATSAGVGVSGHAAQLDQLYDNLVALEAVALPPSNETGQSATLTLPNGTVRTASVFVQDWQVEPVPQSRLARVAFDLVIPAGRFS